MRRRDLLAGLFATTTASALRADRISTLAINDETNALASTISPTPDASWLRAVDTLISTLKRARIWSTFDLFYCFASPSEDACTFNWVDTSEGLLTAHGTLSCHANAYTASNGSTGYFSTTFNVNSGKATDGNAAFGYFCLSEDTANSIGPFQCSGGKHFLGLQASASAINDLTASLNTSTSATFPSRWGSTVGHWVLQQNNTTVELEAFLDGSSLGTSIQTHSADIGTVQIFKTAGGSFASRQTAFVHYGSKLTSAQQLTLSKALYSFLTALDVRPKAGCLGLTTGPTNIAPYKHVSTGNGNNLEVPITISSTSLTGLIQGRAGAYPYGLIRVNDPNYLNLWRLEVHRGDASPFDGSSIDRMQIAAAQNIAWQTTCDISFAFWVESGSVYGSSFMDLIALHDQTTGVNAGPTHAFTSRGQFYVWGFINGTYYNYRRVSCPQGQWHYVRTTFRPDDRPNGFIQSWLDGNQIVNDTRRRWGAEARAPFWWNFALYRGGSTEGPTAVWVANLEIDTSGTQPFASRVSRPLPVPPLT